MQISNRDTPCDAPITSDAPPSILSTKCGGAHKISSIKAPIFLWVGGGGGGVGRGSGVRVGRGGVVGWVMVGWGWVEVCGRGGVWVVVEGWWVV